MSREIRRTRQVREDIVAIYRYIHERSPVSADKVLAAIERPCRSLADTSGVGRYWNSPDARLDGLKVVTVGSYRNYLIFFRTTAGRIELFRIVHAARHLETVVDEIEGDFDWESDAPQN